MVFFSLSLFVSETAYTGKKETAVKKNKKNKKEKKERKKKISENPTRPFWYFLRWLKSFSLPSHLCLKKQMLTFSKGLMDVV